MATKYVRVPESGDRHAPRDFRPPLFRRLRIDAKGRIWLLYIGAAIVLAAAGALNVAGGRFAFAGRPLIRGEGVIVEKGSESGEPPRYWLGLRLVLPDGPILETDATVKEDVFARFKIGDRIGVAYQTDARAQRVRIRETGLVALPVKTP